MASETQDHAGWHTLLTDGRTIDQPDNGTYKVFGASGMPGDLLLASDADGGFATVLKPIGSGCWEGYESPGDSLIVWDMGDSILFASGLELPKAPSFKAEATPHDVDGRKAWTQIKAAHVIDSPRSFCVNEQGEVVSATLYPLSSPH